jgi:hypothetical protein
MCYMGIDYNDFKKRGRGIVWNGKFLGGGLKK